MAARPAPPDIHPETGEPIHDIVDTSMWNLAPGVFHEGYTAAELAQMAPPHEDFDEGGGRIPPWESHPESYGGTFDPWAVPFDVDVSFDADLIDPDYPA